jgi:hypothetical protein
MAKPFTGTVATCVAVLVAKRHFIFRTMESKCIKRRHVCLSECQVVPRGLRFQEGLYSDIFMKREQFLYMMSLNTFDCSIYTVQVIWPKLFSGKISGLGVPYVATLL